MAESLVVIVGMGFMGFSLLLILIPSVPVSALEWAIAILIAAFTEFTRVTPLAALIVTILALVGSTSGIWLPIFGLRGRNLSCMGMIAFFVGMIVGSGVIPIPFLGTVIGGVVGVMLVEYLRIGELREAVESGHSALKVILMTMAAELVFASLIVMTVFISVINTA